MQVEQGKLIVVEGLDGAGRSTQISLLRDWLEANGHATRIVGLSRSNLVSDEIKVAKEGHKMTKRTFALFYATDFMDQLENIILPGLRAGAIVLADRYIYTPIARGIVRGLDRKWLESIYSIAVAPDLTFYLDVTPQILIERNLEQRGELDYWESGMDMGLADNIFDSFMIYQQKMGEEFDGMAERYGFIRVKGDRSIARVNREMRGRISKALGIGNEGLRRRIRGRNAPG
ncbi:MAG: dTMP kinase [Candidatus Thermoplasmatota archaeon]|nr:dTMP kinase [Candidatus Thermoplasmatota archaeon]